MLGIFGDWETKSFPVRHIITERWSVTAMMDTHCEILGISLVSLRCVLCHFSLAVSHIHPAVESVSLPVLIKIAK